MILETLVALCPRTPKSTLRSYLEPLNEVMDYYEMDTTARQAGFLSQIIHESNGFTATRENLNYSADGLRKTFGKYFTIELANQYARQPQRIANRVYANRMGNGPEESGDGFLFRGRGLIQLTGRDNYTRFANGLEMELADTVAYMETPEGACASAGWFWDTNGLNAYCDRDDFIGLTKRINGGTNGLADRQHYYQKALELL